MKKPLAILLAVMMVLLSVNLAAADETASVKAGDIITFGRYPQTEEGADQTPIEWIVLEVQDGKALVISRYGLDAQRYHDQSFVEVTWEICSLRTWLNGEFLNAAFSPEEQAAIPVTEVDNSAAQGCGEWDTAGGNNTQDRIFLLSWAEASRYFGAIELEKENVQARTEPTAYAVSRGAVPNSKDKTENGADAVPWWLRSPGMNQMSAICVYNDGSMVFGNVIGGHTCVRPALWIDPESEIFKSENPRD